jgi:hypothetical protein
MTFQSESGPASFGAKVAVFEWSGSEFYKLSGWILLEEQIGLNILHDNNHFHFLKIFQNLIKTFGIKLELILIFSTF